MSTDRDDGIDLEPDDSPVEDSIDLDIPHPDQARDCSANQLLKFCMLWRMEDLCRLYRDRPAEFQKDRDKLLGRYDVPSSILGMMLKFGLGGPSSSASFLSKEQFRHLTEILAQACDVRNIGWGAIYDFGNYADADLKAATRELDRLERQLRRELYQESTPRAENELPEHASAKQIAEQYGWDPKRVRSELTKEYWGPGGQACGRAARPSLRLDVPNARGNRTRYLWRTVLVIPFLQEKLRNTA